MDLKDFVAGSLTQIAEGIQMAQKATMASGAWINPMSTQTPGGADKTLVYTPEGRRYLQEVTFDVAVTVADEKKADAGAAIKILGARIGADGEVAYKNAAVSRVQFCVHVMWPGDLRPEVDKTMSERRSAIL